MCDSIAVVLGDRVLFAKSSDRDPNEAQLLDWQPARRHPPGATVRCTWIAIPQVAETRPVLLSRPFWMWGAEMGANADGVVIGNEAVFTRARVPDRGLTGMDLVRLGLERASSRGEAADVIAGLIERYGQGGGCGYEDLGFTYSSSFLIADRSGALVFETAGSEHRREEVRGARSISNRLSIASLRRRRGEVIRTAVARGKRRAKLTAAAAQRARGPGDLMAALRDHGGAPRYSPINGAMAAPCMHAGGLIAGSQTVGSWVSELGGPGGDRHWATATSAPCLSVFKPVRIDRPLDLGPAPTGRADRESLWWRFERLHRLALRDLGAPEVDAVRAEAAELEAGGGDSEEAFARFSAWIDAAAERLEPLADRRPRWLRRYWDARRRMAELDAWIARRR